MTSFGKRLAASAGFADPATALQVIADQERLTLGRVTNKGTDVTARLLVLLLIEQRRTNGLLEQLTGQAQ